VAKPTGLLIRVAHSAENGGLMSNGRFFRMSLELFFASLACLAVAVLVPLSFWQGLGEAGSSLAVLTVGALITGAILLRHRPTTAEAGARHPSVESAG
jgi:hypothetical protein